MDPLFGPRAGTAGASGRRLGRSGGGGAEPSRAVPCRAHTRGAAAVGADARRGGRGAIKAAAAAAAERQHHGELPGAGAVRRGGRAAAQRPRTRSGPAAPRARPGPARRRRRLPGEGADRGAAGGAGEAQEQEGTALREEVRAGAHVRRRGAVRREEGGSHREALRLPPGDVVQFLPPQVPVSRGVPGQAAGSAGTDVWLPRRAGDFPQLLRPRNAARSARIARVTPSVTSDIRGAVFFLSPALPQPVLSLPFSPCFCPSRKILGPVPCPGTGGKHPPSVGWRSRGQGTSLGWLRVAGPGGMQVCPKHFGPLSLASPLRGASSAHPGASSLQPSVGFTRTTGLRPNPAELTLCCRKFGMRH